MTRPGTFLAYRVAVTCHPARLQVDVTGGSDVGPGTVQSVASQVVAIGQGGGRGGRHRGAVLQASTCTHVVVEGDPEGTMLEAKWTGILGSCEGAMRAVAAVSG
jgi:hypothetical protein